LKAPDEGVRLFTAVPAKELLVVKYSFSKHIENIFRDLLKVFQPYRVKKRGLLLTKDPK